LRIEEVARRKCLIVTTRPNLPEARTWMDTNLEPMIRKSIPEGIDPPASQLPRRLDKPVYSASSQSYADVLKKQFSIASNATTTTAEHNRPPRKWQAASIINYDSDKSTDAPASNTTVNNSTSNQRNSQPTKVATTNQEYAVELLSIKMEINALRTMIKDAVEQFKTALATFTTTNWSTSSDMDTDANDSKTTKNNNQNATDLAATIQDLKHEIATIITEMRTLFQQQMLLMTHNKCLSSPVTWTPTLTSVGLLSNLGLER